MRMQGTLVTSEEEFVDFVLMLQSGKEIELFYDLMAQEPGDVVLLSKDEFAILVKIDDEGGSGEGVPISVGVDAAGTVNLMSIKSEKAELKEEVGVEKTGAALMAEQVE